MEPASPSPPVGGDGDVPGLPSPASAGDAVPGPDVCTTLPGSSFVNYFSYLGSKGLESAQRQKLENAFDKLVKLMTKQAKDAVLENLAWVVGWLMQYDKRRFNLPVSKAVDLGKTLMDLWYVDLIPTLT